MTHTMDRRTFLKFAAAGAGVSVLAGRGWWHAHRLSPQTSVSRQLSLLGTLVTIRVVGMSPPLADKAIDAAFAAFERVDRVMSIHRNDSDIAIVNGLAGREMAACDPWLCDVLTHTRDLHAMTFGAYDVTCLPLMRLYGFYDTGAKHFPTDRDIASALDVVGQQHIVIDHDRHSVGLTKQGAAIDLGSIGKGFAVDRAADALRSFGVTRALIDAGGNLFGIGSPDDESDGWRIAIRNPKGDVMHPYFETLHLINQAVATSGNSEQEKVLDGRCVGHLFDMRSGRPAMRGVSATVVASNATAADGLSTSSFLLGPEGRNTLLREPADIFYHGYEG